MSGEIFRNCQIYILPNGLLKKRIKLFEEQVTKHGGKIISDIRNTMPTHIIVEENCFTSLNQIRNILRKTVELDCENLKCDVVGTLWLSRCLKYKNLLDTENFKFKDYESKIEIENQVVKDELPRKIRRTQVFNICTISFSKKYTHRLSSIYSIFLCVYAGHLRRSVLE